MDGHGRGEVELVVIKRSRELREPTKVSRLPLVKHGVRIVPVREDSRSRRSRVVEVHSVVQAEPERKVAPRQNSFKSESRMEDLHPS